MSRETAASYRAQRICIPAPALTLTLPRAVDANRARESPWVYQELGSTQRMSNSGVSGAPSDVVPLIEIALPEVWRAERVT